MKFLRLCTAVLLCACVSLVTSEVYAQAWPTKPVRFIVGAGAGSAPDVILRLLADRLSKTWGQPVVVENRPGAGGIAATTAVAQTAPDGYTFLFGLGSALAMNQFLYRSLPFDPEKDFAPVVSMGTTPMIIVANRTADITSIADLLRMAKARPGKLPVGTTSKSAAHLTIESLAQQSGTQFLHAFYKSAPNAYTDMLGGQVSVFSDALAAVPNLDDPKIRVLAITAAKRLPNLPSIPVVAETVPGFVAYGWYAIMAPAKTSSEIIDKVNRDVNAIVRAPEIVARLQELATYDAGGTPEQLNAFIKSERQRLSEAVRAAKIDPE